MCIIVNSVTILANVFAIRDDPISFKELTKFVKHLQEVLPTYMLTDFDEAHIISVSLKYPDLYTITESEDNMIIHPGKLRPKTEYFNSMYSKSWSEIIENVTKSYFGLPKPDLKPCHLIDPVNI